MTPFVFAVILGAALLHASWNALVKSGADKTLSMAAVVIGHMPFALLVLMVSPAPRIEALPFLLAGIGLHLLYQLLLLRSYELGDLTQVYPLARGVAPLLVAVVSVLVLGVALSPLELLSIVCISVGIASLAGGRHADGARNTPAATAAVLAGGCIAAYSLVDGYGARVAGTSLGFYGWLAIGNGLAMMLVVSRRRPGLVRTIPRVAPVMFWVGGGASFGAYALVTWAFTQAPIPLVTALRESSIIVALLIGVFVLGEKINFRKVLATALTLLGLVLQRLHRA